MSSQLLRSRFAAAIRRLLRPVVRQLIAYGVSYPAFSRMVKQLYVEVAEHDFALPFKRQTDSRVALLTGLPRKEVKQIRNARRAVGPTTAVEDTVMTHVIGRWMAGPPYATPDGKPARLPYDSNDASAVTFARLVRELGADIPVRAVLDEMIRAGSAELQPNGDVILCCEAHIPSAEAAGKLTLLGSDPAEMFSTIVHNIEQGDCPWLQRKVVYDNVGAEALAEVRAEAQQLGEAFMRRANALLSSYDRDRHPDAAGGGRSRVVVGAYYFEETQAPQPAQTMTGGASVPPGRIRRSE